MKYPTSTGVKVVDGIALDFFPLEMRTATNAKGIGGRSRLRGSHLHHICLQATTYLVQRRTLFRKRSALLGRRTWLSTCPGAFFPVYISKSWKVCYYL